jgi:hypothetical protein
MLGHRDIIDIGSVAHSVNSSFGVISEEFVEFSLTVTLS